jgi:aspartate racemase
VKRIGLLGGIGPASTVLYYEELINRGRGKGGHSPEIFMASLDFELFTLLEETDTAAYVELIVDGCMALQAAGADVLAMAANSPHTCYELVAPRLDRPLVHIAEAVCRRADELGIRQPLLLGIPITLRSAFYHDIGTHYGLEMLVPDPKHDDLLRRVVFDELTFGVVRPESREEILALLNGRPIDGLILGCTELGLLIDPEHVDVPVLDSLSIHVDAILRAAGDASTTQSRQEVVP